MARLGRRQPFKPLLGTYTAAVVSGNRRRRTLLVKSDMEYLKQSTAFTETVGPILDSTGAEYTGAVIGDLSISKNGTEAAMAAAATLTHVSNGHYTLVGTTGNSDTLGRTTIRCNKSTYQMPVKEYMVLPATVYDALVTNATTAAGGLGDVQRINGVSASPVTTIKAVIGLTTADTIATVSNAITLPTIPTDWITANGIAADAIGSSELAASAVTEMQSGLATSSALSAVAAQLPTALTSNGNLKVSLQEILTTALTEGATGRIAAAWQGAFNVTSPVFTMQAVNQTGDSYARIGANGISLSAIPDLAGVTTLLVRVGGTINVTNLNTLSGHDPGSQLAASSEVTSIQNNTRVVRVVPDDIELPSAGTRTYRIELLLYDEVGNMEAPDSAPTIALVNQAGTDRSTRLDSTTMTLVSTGRYRAIYTSTAGDTKEQLVWAFSVVEGGATRLYGNNSYITDAIATDFTSSDRTLLTTLSTDYTTARAAKLDNLDATISSRMATFTLPTNFSSMAIDASGRVTVGAFLSTLDLTTTMKASVNTEADTALADYDAPTHTEMTAELATADDATLAQVALVKAKTDLIPASPAAVGSPMTLTSAYDAAKTAATQASVTSINDLIEATKWIDTSTVPWALVYIRKGTGNLGTGVELLRQSLYTASGANITTTDDVIGRSVA
jgi:drug/metabolite transporter superfamily protein YnfA